MTFTYLIIFKSARAFRQIFVTCLKKQNLTWDHFHKHKIHSKYNFVIFIWSKLYKHQISSTEKYDGKKFKLFEKNYFNMIEKKKILLFKRPIQLKVMWSFDDLLWFVNWFKIAGSKYFWRCVEISSYIKKTKEKKWLRPTEMNKNNDFK
jgi:hypothetical protein